MISVSLKNEGWGMGGGGDNMGGSTERERECQRVIKSVTGGQREGR